MDLSQYDASTQKRFAAAEKLLTYKPNNEKILQFHKSDSKTRLLLGGKRSGKSTAGIVEVCWAALGIHPFLDYPPPPLKIRICSVDFSTSKQIVLPLLYTWIPKNAIKKYWAEDRIMELVNGTEIDIRSYEMDLEKFEGVEKHLVCMDEEPSQEIYKANYMRTISGGINGKLIITCTPIHGLSWLYYTMYDNPEAIPPYVEHWHVSTRENPYLDQTAIDAVYKDPAMKDSADMVLHGKFFSHSGLIYPMFDTSRHVIQSVKGIPDDWLVILGIDPHDRNPHGVVFCGLTKENVWIAFDELYEHCTITDLFNKIKAKLGKRFPPNLAVIDTSGNTPQSISGLSVSDMLKKLGLYVLDAHKDVKAGRLKVTELLNPGVGKLPRLYVTGNCNNLIREFKTYQWDNWSPAKRDKLDPKERPMKRDDHLQDSLRYAIMSNVVYRNPHLAYKPKIPDIVGHTGYY